MEEYTEPDSPNLWMDLEGVRRVMSPGVPYSERTQWVREHLGNKVTTVRSLKDVRRPDLVYYIPQWDNFAVRVGPIVLYGNLGRTEARDTPLRTKKCSRGRCGAKCTFYHPPGEGSGEYPEMHVRDFRPQEWEDRTAKRKNSPHKPFGGFDRLDYDIATASDDDIDLHRCQTMHDILIALVVAERRAAEGRPVWEA
jgi:hypothetical protein